MRFPSLRGRQAVERAFVKVADAAILAARGLFRRGGAVGTEESRSVVQRWLALAGAGDIDGAFALFADDALWSNIGTTRYSGDFRGREEILGRLIGPLFTQLEGGISSEVEAVIADGEHVVVLSRGSAMTREGTPYNNTYAQVFTVRGGRITAVREYMDTALVDRVFGAA
jgi:ketosteroid isomerase-like protein